MPSAPAPPAGPSRRSVLRGAAGALGAGLAVTVAPSATAPSWARAPRRPPNVVLISIDDLGWNDLGCYGNDLHETPRIDRLAEEGLRFTDAYAAAPVCSPARAALMTGLYPARTGITDFLRPEEAVSDKHLGTDVPAVPQVLGPLGYTTGLIGKWHLSETYSGPPAQRSGSPESHGFDEVVASEEAYIAAGDYTYPYFFLPQLQQRIEPEEYLTDRLALETEDFLERHRDEPFFVHVSNYAVHTTWEARPDLLAKWEDVEGVEDSPKGAVFAAMLESVDDQVGRVVDKLTELGIAERTLVLVTSDNGGAPAAANAPLRGGKGVLYEGGIRVPLVAWWPGTVEAGREDATPVSGIDVLSTALDLARRAAADGQQGRGPAAWGLDGASLAPLLLPDAGSAAPLEERTLFWDYPHYIGGTQPMCAVRRGDLKLVRHLRKEKDELFDLAEDPSETTDLGKERPRDRVALARALDAHLRDVALLVPSPLPAAYPRAEPLPSWADDGGLDAYDVLLVPSGEAPASGTVSAADDGAVAVTTSGTQHVLLRSPVAPGSDRVAAVVEIAQFADLGPEAQDTVFVGLAEDAGTYLLLRYHHGLRRVGWDLRVDGALRLFGQEPLTRLDGEIDLSEPGSRFGFTLRGSQAAAWVDQRRGRGWQFLFQLDTGGAFDLADPTVRARTRYATGARVSDATMTLGSFGAARALG